MTKSRLMHVSRNFHTFVKLKAAEEDKSIIELTDEWAKSNGITTKKTFFKLEEDKDKYEKKKIKFSLFK